MSFPSSAINEQGFAPCVICGQLVESVEREEVESIFGDTEDRIPVTDWEPHCEKHSGEEFDALIEESYAAWRTAGYPKDWRGVRRLLGDKDYYITQFSLAELAHVAKYRLLTLDEISQLTILTRELRSHTKDALRNGAEDLPLFSLQAEQNRAN